MDGTLMTPQGASPGAAWCRGACTPVAYGEEAMPS
ncbi:MAG: hypothetical protein JWR00_4544, partial [Rubritepida sp.]|nr:hypothetical protein [Rubritepida sp.]